ncbi:isopentenyl diphosphate isomerase/L-lactate dehydrogenase-like FMN-dependent dehydrogenase [Paraburkholderia sp. GAS32]
MLARAAAKFGIPFVLSTASTSSIEEVARESEGELWFQLYVANRRLAELFVKRALNSGYTTLILTTDVDVNGKRERDIRNGFGLPMKYTLGTIMDGALHPGWSLDLLRHGAPQLANFASNQVQDTELQAALMSRQMDASFSFDDLAWLRSLWPHKLLIKGISRPADAERCIKLGADGVIMFNHGGRQLDSAIWKNLQAILADINRQDLNQADGLAARIKQAREAALADPEGRKLAQALGLPVPEPAFKPINFVRNKRAA